MIASYMSKLRNMGLSEASDIFSKMSNDKFIDVLGFIEDELKFNISLSFGSERLLWNDVKYALYFVEYLKNTKKEKYDRFHYFTKDDLKDIFEEILYKKNENFLLRDFDRAIDLLTGNYCRDLLRRGTSFGGDKAYKINPYSFISLQNKNFNFGIVE